MLITMTKATSKGLPLSVEKFDFVKEQASIIISLNKTKETFIAYVQSRMQWIAPNLVALIGSESSAQLMSVAGGLSNLSKIPACNIQVLGKRDKHHGIVFYSDLVQNVPAEKRNKANRLVAAKCALAARLDISGSYEDGRGGRDLLAEVESKIALMTEAPPEKKVKALPKPFETTGKKRGGKRARREKEKYGMTQVRREDNRMTFGADDSEKMVTSTSIRKSVAKEGNKLTLSKKTKARLGKLAAPPAIPGFQTSVPGIKTSLTFAAGSIELGIAQKQEKEKNKWFGGGFNKSDGNKE